MEVSNGVQNVPEPSPESVELKVLDPSPDNESPIHCFAHTLAEDIVHSATYESSSGCPPVQERLAEKLASLAITAALKEAIGSELFWSNTRSWSYSNPSPSSDRREQGLHNTIHGEVHMQTEMSGNSETPQSNPNVTIKSHSSGSSTSTSQPSKYALSYCSFLPQSGLPTVGSLDYPDAPPTTPLLPEMVQSRASFTRKLKGRLAKEFLLAPPLPPRKSTERGAGVGDRGEVEDTREGEEFMGRLLRSLSLECSEREEVWKEEEEFDIPTGILTDGNGEVSHEERGPHGRRAKLMVYVDALSDEITTWMTNNMTNIDDLSLMSDQMADQIITSSMSEVRLRRYVGRLVSDALSLGWEEQKAASLHDSLVLRQEQIGRGEPNPTDQEAHLIVYPYPYPTTPNQSSSIQLCSPKPNEMDLDLTTNTAHPPAHSPTSVISQSYAEDLARAVVRCCVIEASRKQCM